MLLELGISIKSQISYALGMVKKTGNVIQIGPKQKEG